jgi:hypothetical protein
VIKFCGADRYSSFQVKFVFKELAKFSNGDTENIEKGFIPIVAFKDTFYPGKTYNSDFQTNIIISKEKKEKESQASNKSQTDVFSESMRISQAMAGKTKDDLNAETLKVEKE